jgi:hypothetical protein
VRYSLMAIDNRLAVEGVDLRAARPDYYRCRISQGGAPANLSGFGRGSNATFRLKRSPARSYVFLLARDYASMISARARGRPLHRSRANRTGIEARCFSITGTPSCCSCCRRVRK